MSYFQHHYASNSDLKEIVARHEGRMKPENIQEIFDFGSALHAAILEPHKVEWEKFDEDEQQMLKMMRDTFWRDQMCRDIVMMPDFRREHEFYRVNRFGLEGVRCKTDGETAKIQTILELKGLRCATYKAFIESIEHLDYDQGSNFYIDTATGCVNYKQKLIVGISKQHEDRLFKVLINRDHQLYKNGGEKVKKAVKLWHAYGMK